MSLPSAVTKTNLDSGSDDVAQARAELATALDAINTLITHLGTSSITSGSTVLTPGNGLAVLSSALGIGLSFTAKTANYTALTTDRAKVINFTTAGVTLSLTAAATLADGWFCVVVNSASSGVVTIDPNSTETIDGYTTIVLLPGQSCFVLCNGAAFRTVGRPRIAQVVTYQTGDVATGSTQLPTDNSIPQSGEGDQYMELAITPTNASSTLIIEVVFIGSTSAAGAIGFGVALFQDSTVNALAAVPVTSPSAGSVINPQLRHKMTAGTTSATTFKVRAGANAAGTTTFNGSGGTRIFGGVAASSIKITEVLP
jgi:hypothetical protein